jgi:hypothetical protein
MKKYIFLFIVAVTSVISCTKGGLLETPASYADRITFEPYIGKAPVTKAENADFAFLKTGIENTPYSGGFEVLAFEHKADGTAPDSFITEYMDVNVGWTDASDDEEAGWVCDVVYYWPEDQSLSFAAVGLNAVKGGCLARQSDMVSYTFEVKPYASQQVDLIVAPYQTGWNAKKNDGIVNLKFEHLLSRIGFKVQSTAATEGVDIAIRSIKLCGAFPTYADLNLSLVDENGKPFVSAKDGENEHFTYEYSLFDNSTYSFSVSSTDCYDSPAEIYPNSRLNAEAETIEWKPIYADDETDAIAKAKNRRYMMVMPCTQTSAANAHLEVVYQLTEGDMRTASVPLGNITFAPNTTYEFILSVSTATIEFDATLEKTEWDRAQDENGNYLPNEVIPLFPEV